MQLAYPLLNKIAIVTGGSRGIGAATSKELASRGAKVALTYVSAKSKEYADKVVDEIHQIHSERDASSKSETWAIAIQADAGDLEAPAKIVKETLGAFNTNTINILVNNAGAVINENLGDVKVSSYDHVMNVNTRGVIFLTQEVLPHIPKGGRIVNISSISATEGFFGQTVYAASKAAIDGLTKVWATELGRDYGITVNSINPGPVDTNMFNSSTSEFEKMVFETCPPSAGNRKADPQDIADIIGFLVDEKSRWVTGDTVSANGGGIYRG